ncbi:uncharacterized protein TRIADDRAFT_26627, partial [Trichoplax adhaerens]
YSLTGYIGEMQGERDEMQDAYYIQDDLTGCFDEKPKNADKLGFYGIFDGHAGKRASQYAAENLHKLIVQMYPKGKVANKDREIKMCLTDAFKKTDDAFLQLASAATPTWKDGSTASTVLVVDNVLYIANLGDSKAVLCRYTDDGKVTALRLTKDQTPTDYEERMRIQKCGGFVKDGRVMGILEVARSIGDGRFKHCGVSCIPDVKRCTLTKNDKFVVIACDGLWKSFGVDEAISYVDSRNSHINVIILHFCILDDEQTKQMSQKSIVVRRHAAVCRQLAKEAVRKQSGDNVTVMLIMIEHEDL